MKEQPKCKAVIFDLDGTLLDSLADYAAATNKILQNFGFPTYPVDSYRYFTGDGMDGMAKKVLPETNRNGNMVKDFVVALKDEYRQCFTKTTKPYQGIPELLDFLEDISFPKAILTNKPTEFAKIMVGELLNNWSFDVVQGTDSRIPKKPDSAGAREIAAKLSILPRECILVGDSKTDMQTAVAAGMYPVGALWGYRDRNELLSYGAKIILKHPMDLEKILLSG